MDVFFFNRKRKDYFLVKPYQWLKMFLNKNFDHTIASIVGICTYHLQMDFTINFTNKNGLNV